MSHESIYQATMDQALQYRVIAGAQKEARNHATLKDTQVAANLRQAPSTALQYFVWPVSIDYEAEYKYALDSANPDPGGDEGVISDGNISAAVAAHWPPDPAP